LGYGLNEFGYRRERERERERERDNQSVVINCIKCSQKNTKFGIAKISFLFLLAPFLHIQKENKISVKMTFSLSS
jgi:hypothetical protein